MNANFIVLYRNIPVRFVSNVCGRVYSLTSEEEATRFASQDEAYAAAERWGITWEDIVVKIV